MRCEYPTDGQVGQLRQLWRLAFGDSEAFLDLFFGTAYAPERCRCILSDGQAAAALYWFDGGSDGQKYAYLYAIATHPGFRNRGLCRELMENTHALLAEKGYDGVLLKPDGDALRNMYAKLGYRDCGAAAEFDCAAGDKPVALRAISKTEYARLRRTFLPRGGVVQEGENLDFIEGFSRFYAGEDFLLTAAPDGEKLRGIELLGSADAAPGILVSLGYPQGRFRTPGKEIPFAMFRPLHPNAKAPEYFGLAFD